MRIGVDIDGVMYQWEKTARYMLREILPDSPYTKDGSLGSESTHWNYIADNVSPEHWKWLWTEGVRLGLFRYGHMHPGTIKAVRELAKLGEVIAITHRPKDAVEDTLAWLSFNKLPLSGIHILTNQEPKTSVQRCDYYIDDKPENCIELLTTGSTVAMPLREWNEQEWKSLLDVISVKDLHEFVELINDDLAN